MIRSPTNYHPSPRNERKRLPSLDGSSIDLNNVNVFVLIDLHLCPFLFFSVDDRVILFLHLNNNVGLHQQVKQSRLNQSLSFSHFSLCSSTTTIVTSDYGSSSPDLIVFSFFLSDFVILFCYITWT